MSTEKHWISWATKVQAEPEHVTCYKAGQCGDLCIMCAVVDGNDEERVWGQLKQHFPDLVPRFSMKQLPSNEDTMMLAQAVFDYHLFHDLQTQDKCAEAPSFVMYTIDEQYVVRETMLVPVSWLEEVPHYERMHQQVVEWKQNDNNMVIVIATDKKLMHQRFPYCDHHNNICTAKRKMFVQSVNAYDKMTKNDTS